MKATAIKNPTTVDIAEAVANIDADTGVDMADTGVDTGTDTGVHMEDTATNLPDSILLGNA